MYLLLVITGLTAKFTVYLPIYGGLSENRTAVRDWLIYVKLFSAGM